MSAHHEFPRGFKRRFNPNSLAVLTGPRADAARADVISADPCLDSPRVSGNADQGHPRERTYAYTWGTSKKSLRPDVPVL